MTTTPLTHLLDGRSIDPPFPLPTNATIALLDWMADISHGPTGGGPENVGAEHVLRVLGYHLQNDRDAGALLGTVRDAVAHESPAERRAPSATTAVEAAEALRAIERDLQADHLTQGPGLARRIAGALPTPIHARYALSLIVESYAIKRRDAGLFDAVARHLVDHDEAGPEDHTYVERLRSLLIGDAA